MKKTILLVEDDLATIDVYEIALTKAGFEVEVASSGSEAIERIKAVGQGAKKPDLVLLDLLLPDINGIEVLKEIRGQKETKDTLVFVMTNYTDGELEKIGYKLKAEKSILKAEYTPSQLAELVKKRLEG